MYIVTINNDGTGTEIHGASEKCVSGSIVKGINTIDSFSFELLPSNIGFNLLREFKTLVSVYNTKRNRYEFYGRVLYSNPAMESNGMISKKITCESYMGFLCDSVQKYMDVQNWTVEGLLQQLIETHNSQVEDYKQFVLGDITVEDENDNLYCGIQRENTWDTIKKKLLDVLGGELQFRVENDVIYLDYLKEIGTTRTTKIAVGENIKTMTQEKDPSSYVTRLIPLGCKLTKDEITTDEEGNETVRQVETEERLDITSVNDGIEYIDDVQAIEKYGLHIACKEWDDVTMPNILKTKGENWLIDNNKVKIKYTITALDLSLLGLVIDDFNVHDYYPLENELLGVKDTARITKKTIDICEEVKSTIEIGENFKTLSDLQIDQTDRVNNATETIKKIESDYVTNQVLSEEKLLINTLIKQTAESIVLAALETYVNTDNEEFKQEIRSLIEILSNEINFKFTQTTEQIVNVDGNMQTKFTELYQYIQFANGSLTLGTSDSTITLKVENDMITFAKNGVVFGSWDGENFYTGNIIIRLGERLQLGNYAALPRSDSSVMWLKVGGN